MEELTAADAKKMENGSSTEFDQVEPIEKIEIFVDAEEEADTESSSRMIEGMPGNNFEGMKKLLF